MKEDDKPETPSRTFLKRLYDELKGSGDLSLDSFQAAVRKARAHAGGKAKAEKSKSMAESLTDLIEKVQTALYNEFRNRFSGESQFSYAKEVFTDYVISCSNTDGKDYKIPFSIENDEVAFGEPEEVETIYVPVGTDVIGMHDVADLCADGRGMRLFNEFHFADPPEWFNFLPRPGKYESPTYGEIVITDERNKTFVDNFTKKVYQEKLPIDCEHDISASGAVGWITDMKINPDGGVDAKAEWNDRGKELIENDRFKYFSPSWFSIWTDPVDPDRQIFDVAIGGALTTRPFFKEKALRPLIASERGISVFEGDPKNLNAEGVVILNFTALTPVENSKGDLNMADDKDTKAGADDSKGILAKLKDLIDGAPPKTADEPAKAGEAITPQAFSDLQAKVQAAETESKAKDDLLVKASERITALEKDARAKRFSEIAKGWVGDVNKHVATLELLQANEGGEESEAFKNYVESMNAAAEQLDTAKLFTEVGSSVPVEGSAAAEVDSLVKQFREADPKLTEAQAFTKVWDEKPELRKRYRAEEHVN